MKLLLQADDYGITRGVAKGIVYGIEHGIIRNTGLFANMPWTAECVEWIRPCLNKISFGIDLNITTGSPLLSVEKIPTLVKENGTFYTSWESRRLDAERAENNHAASEDSFKEYDAQIQRFIKLVGKKPDYIHSHAYSTERTIQIQRDLAKKYGILYSSDVWKKIVGYEVPQYRIPWYLKPATFENQMKSSLKQYILENSTELLEHKYSLIVGHMGYVDRELTDLSTYSLYRINDLDAVISPEILRWVEDNHVEIVTYLELEKELMS